MRKGKTCDSVHTCFEAFVLKHSGDFDATFFKSCHLPAVELVDLVEDPADHDIHPACDLRRHVLIVQDRLEPRRLDHVVPVLTVLDDVLGSLEFQREVLGRHEIVGQLGVFRGAVLAEPILHGQVDPVIKREDVPVLVQVGELDVAAGLEVVDGAVDVDASAGEVEPHVVVEFLSRRLVHELLHVADAFPGVGVMHGLGCRDATVHLSVTTTIAAHLGHVEEVQQELLHAIGLFGIGLGEPGDAGDELGVRRSRDRRRAGRDHAPRDGRGAQGLVQIVHGPDDELDLGFDLVHVLDAFDAFDASENEGVGQTTASFDRGVEFGHQLFRACLRVCLVAFRISGTQDGRELAEDRRGTVSAIQAERIDHAIQDLEFLADVFVGLEMGCPSAEDGQRIRHRVDNGSRVS